MRPAANAHRSSERQRPRNPLDAPRPADTILDPETLPLGGDRWDWTIIALLGGMFLFMPAAFGAVEAWSQLVVVLWAAAIALVLVVRLFIDRHFRLARTWLYLPLAGFAALAALQLLPLPILLHTIAPAHVTLRQELLGHTFQPGDLATLSFYPLATSQHLRLLLVGIIVFAAVASVCRGPRHVKAMLTVIFTIGCAQGLLALAQIATGTGSIYWSIPIKGDSTTAGTFVNYSNFSQFMNLSLGAGLGLLLVRLQEQRRDERDEGSWGFTPRIYWEENAWVFAGILLCALAILASMSRNGAISMLAAAALVGTALYQRRSLNWRGWLLGALPAAALAILLVFGFDIVYARLATLQETDVFTGRWQMTLAALRAWQQFPVWGTGLGTHEIVFSLFESSATPSIAGHADNDYAQALEESGIVGAALIAAFLLGIAAIAIQLARHGRRSVSMAVYGVLFGLTAVAIHSATDFGQRLPANLSLSAAMCGLLVAVARLDGRRQTFRPGRFTGRAFRTWPRLAADSVVLLPLALLCGWAAHSAYAAYLGERWWTAALTIDNHLREDPEETTDGDYIDLIAATQAALTAEPGNIHYGYWLNYYRWESLSRTVDTETGQTLLHPDTLPFVSRIADELAEVRLRCPTFGPPYALEGQLRLFILGEPQGAELIRTAARLAPYDPPTCLVAGELAAHEGKLADAEELLSRAVKLQPSYFSEIIKLALNDINRPDLAHSLAAGDHHRLHQLAAAMDAMPGYQDYAQELRFEAETILRRRVSESDASPQEVALLARIELESGNLESAIALFRQGLSFEYRQVDWRLDLARALAQHGQIDDAVHEVRVALRLRPHYPQATKLLEDLTIQRENSRAKNGR